MMKPKPLSYRETALLLDQCTEMACVLVRNRRPFWHPEAWLYWGLQKAFRSPYNHSSVFFYRNGEPILVCQAIGKGVVFETYDAWASREVRQIKELGKRTLILTRVALVLTSFYAKYDYWKYVRGIFLEQSEWAKKAFPERTRPPFYCHELFAYYMRERLGPWHPNRLISAYMDI
jgi:hypothetical protein